MNCKDCVFATQPSTTIRCNNHYIFVPSESVVCDGFKPQPKTNADRIRAMTDEELASLLMYFADDTDEIDENDYDAFGDTEWRERMLRWLKQEVK